MLGTSISKMFARVQHMPGVLLTMIGLSGLFAGVNVVSLILAATAVNKRDGSNRGSGARSALSLSHLRLTLPLLPLQVDQALFVPATVMATLVFNMLTGILLWEDWKVIHQWIAYVMVRARARLEFAPAHLDPGRRGGARAASCSSHASSSSSQPASLALGSAGAPDHAARHLPARAHGFDHDLQE